MADKDALFPRGAAQVAKGWRNAWLLNIWRMRRSTENGVVIDYFVRGETIVVTRIRMAFDV